MADMPDMNSLKNAPRGESAPAWTDVDYSLKNAPRGESVLDRAINGFAQLQARATIAGSMAISGATLDVRPKATPTNGHPTTNHTAALETRTVAQTETLAPKPIKVGSKSQPVDLVVRQEAADAIRSKFDDIFEVDRNKDLCSVFEHIPFENFSDEVNTVGCFCTSKALSFFRALNASPYVLNIIENGHHPVLTSKVESYEIENRGSFKKYEEFAIPELLKLIKTGRVEIVKEKPAFLNPLHVVQQPNKKRLILDCSYLNNFIEIPKFKYEDQKTALSFFKKNGFMISYDLKDGYNQVLIDKRFRKYLSFKFVYKGQTIYARYVCGPFGLKDLPYVFTKLFRPLIKHWRACALYVVQFLDDGWACFSSLREAAEGSEHIRKDLLRFGAVWSVKKCCWNPCQQVDWIGFTWNCVEGTIKVKASREAKIISTCQSLLEKRSASARCLASFTGQIISMMPVIDNLASLHTRFSQMAVAQAQTWDSLIEIDREIKAEIIFWLDNIQSLNVKYVFEVEVPGQSVSIKGDASNSGCGSFIEGTEHVAARLFSPDECARHSTWRELENVRFSMSAFGPLLKGSKVTFYTDNQSTQRILKSGSMKRECHMLAKSTVDFCNTNDISLDVQWIPREKNKEADAISREPEILDTDDWGLSRSFVSFLERRYGKFSLDAFANDYNCKCDQFCSLYHVPGSSGIDAFNFDWSNEFLLLVPPVSIIGRVLQHLLLCQAKGVLVVPCWPSAYYWPLLINDFKIFIKDILKVKGANILVSGRNKNSLLGSSGFTGFMLALQMDCSNSR